MLEINAGQLVARPVVIAVQTETRNRVGDDSLRRQHVVVGTTEEILLRMRISDEPRAMLREFRPQIRSFIAGQPERVGGNGRIRATNHFEFKIGDKTFDRCGRMLLKIARAPTANLLAAEQSARWCSP